MANHPGPRCIAERCRAVATRSLEVDLLFLGQVVHIALEEMDVCEDHQTEIQADVESWQFNWDATQGARSRALLRRSP